MKVNLGCGSDIKKGYVNIDIRELPGVNVICDIRNLEAFQDEIWDEVYWSHTIEHFTYAEIKNILAGIWLKMKPGAKLEVYCPNAYLIAKDFIGGLITCGEFSRLLLGNQSNEFDLHKAAIDLFTLEHLLIECGFTVISKEPRPNSYKYDMGIQAVK